MSAPTRRPRPIIGRRPPQEPTTAEEQPRPEQPPDAPSVTQAPNQPSTARQATTARSWTETVPQALTKRPQNGALGLARTDLFQTLILPYQKRLATLRSAASKAGGNANAVSTAEIDVINANIRLVVDKGAGAQQQPLPPEVVQKEQTWSAAVLKDVIHSEQANPTVRIVDWLLSETRSDMSQPEYVLRALQSWSKPQGLADAVKNAKSQMDAIRQPVSSQPTGQLKTVLASFEGLSRTSKFQILQLVSDGFYNIQPGAVGPLATSAMQAFRDPDVFVNVKTIGDTLALHPKLGQLMTDQKVKFQCLSPKADAYGGAALLNNTIFFNDEVSKDTQHFAAYAFHEIGHATLQRWLTKGKAVTPDQAVNPTPDLLTPEGLTFYNAWKALNGKDTRQYLFVPADLGIGGGDDGTRQDYLAKGFNEFCAESFMHMILMPDDLKTFVDGLQKGNAPQAVKDAYKAALGILQKFQGQYL